jgi:hypothetical protein
MCAVWWFCLVMSIKFVSFPCCLDLGFWVIYSELGSYNDMQYEDILYVQASQEL